MLCFTPQVTNLPVSVPVYTYNAPSFVNIHIKPESGKLRSWKKTLPTERDFSEHNIAARKTEGTIEKQEMRRKYKEMKKKQKDE